MTEMEENEAGEQCQESIETMCGGMDGEWAEDKEEEKGRRMGGVI